MATVIPIEELRRSPRAALFEGRDDVPISIFVTNYGRGQGASGETLRVVSVHPSATVQQTDLQP